MRLIAFVQLSLQVFVSCLIIYCINLLFRMRAEWIPQGYGIRSARIRNMGAMWCGIPESVHTPCPLFLK